MGSDEGILPERIRSELTTQSLARRIYFIPEVDSTNRLASELAKGGEPDGTLVITDHQTRGRGRHQNQWLSPPHKNLLFSLILRPGIATHQLLAMSLCFSVCVAETLSDFLSVDIGVKWPNDVVIPEGKLCGILTEGSSRGRDTQVVIVGTGLNVNMGPQDFADSGVENGVSCLSLTNSVHDRAVILGRLLSEVETVYNTFVEDGFSMFVGRYNERLLIKNKRVEFEEEGRPKTGHVIAVADTGALIVDVGGGERVQLMTETIALR